LAKRERHAPWAPARPWKTGGAKFLTEAGGPVKGKGQDFNRMAAAQEFAGGRFPSRFTWGIHADRQIP
jgi:hypothetical protein